MTVRILHHLILVGGKTIDSPSSLKLPQGSPEEKIQYAKENQNEEKSIHSGVWALMPQSYVTGSLVSRNLRSMELKN
jgi:hypothetical protein